jgi:hypothetical protein
MLPIADFGVASCQKPLKQNGRALFLVVIIAAFYFGMWALVHASVLDPRFTFVLESIGHKKKLKITRCCIFGIFLSSSWAQFNGPKMRLEHLVHRPVSPPSAVSQQKGRFASQKWTSSCRPAANCRRDVLGSRMGSLGEHPQSFKHEIISLQDKKRRREEDAT